MGTTSCKLLGLAFSSPAKRKSEWRERVRCFKDFCNLDPPDVAYYPG